MKGEQRGEDSQTSRPNNATGKSAKEKNEFGRTKQTPAQRRQENNLRFKGGGVRGKRDSDRKRTCKIALIREEERVPQGVNEGWWITFKLTKSKAEKIRSHQEEKGSAAEGKVGRGKKTILGGRSR